MRNARSSLFLAVAVTLAACQPSPGERYSRAEDYAAQHEYRAAAIELKNALQQEPGFGDARYLLAQASFQIGDFPTAQAEAERALAQGLTHSGVWFELGRALMAQGLAQEALERVVPDLETETASARELVLLGDIYFALGNTGEAADHYLRASNLDPDEVGALVGQAAIAANAGDNTRAIELLTLAGERNPDSSFVFRARGDYLRSIGRDAEAVKALSRAIDLETKATPVSDQLVSRIARVTAMLDANEVDAAAEAMQELTARFPQHPHVGYLRGRLAYAEGDFEVAEEALREYLAIVPDDPVGIALMGAVSFSQNHLRQAEMYLQQAVRNRVGGNVTAGLLAETRLRLDKPGAALDALGSPGAASNDPALLALQGRARLGLGETAAALELFELGAASNSGNEAVNLSLAAGFYSAGAYQRATELLEGMPETTDGNLRRQALLIASHIGEGNTDEARAVAASLKRDYPDDASALSIVGMMHETLGETDRAKAAFEEALDKDVANPVPAYVLGGFSARDGRLNDAVDFYRAALDRQPDFVPALSSMAGLLLDSGDVAELERYVDAALDDNRNLLDAWLLKARLAFGRGGAAEALAVLQNARDSFPGEPRLDHAEALLQIEQGQRESALATLRQAALDDGGNARIQLDLAQLSLDAGDIKGANDAIDRYRALRPDDETGMSAQVAILLRQANFARAEQVLDTFVQRNGTSRRIDIMRGDVLLGAGNTDAAIERYEAAASAGMDRSTAVRLSRAYRRAGRPDAIDPLERWIDANPDDYSARRLYGQWLESEGRAGDAVRQYEALVDAGVADAVTLNNLAWQYAASDRPEAAVELARQAYELASDNGSIVDTYGWVLYLNGDYTRALETLQRASELSPSNPEIQYHLAAVHAKLGNRAIAAAIMDGLLEKHPRFPSRADAEALANSL